MLSEWVCLYGIVVVLEVVVAVVVFIDFVEGY